MFQVPEYNKILSMRLSKVLEDIGVDEIMVMKRRRRTLLTEAINNEMLQFQENVATDIQQLQNRTQWYYLGSQSEGTTTIGLQSDSDQLICHQHINVLQDWSQWKPYVPNYLMIQDEKVSPGYCLLQLLRKDIRLPCDTVPNKYHFKDRLGRILIRNNTLVAELANTVGGSVHGPANTREGQHVIGDTDSVFAFLCKSWPVKARFKLEEEHRWPSEDMRRYFATAGCFVVPVGSKGGEYELFEWRISTSLAERLNQSNGFSRAACRMIAPLVCTMIGSIMASINIQEHNVISAEAYKWISLGLNTDVASSKLKLASMLYSIGELHRAEIVLREIERKYDLKNVEPVCGCYYYSRGFKKSFCEIADNNDEVVLRNITASCVCFIPCEINCVPQELRYEMFRSTQEDVAFREIVEDWMDFAVVDSLTYQYYLQYKTYARLGYHFDRQIALHNLIKTINQESNLGHRETALNLLGQCMEKEGQVRKALQCYQQSLHLRGKNNAAKLHLCMLLNTLVNGKQ